MNRFIEFEQEVSLEELRQTVNDTDAKILSLCISKLTGTIKVRFDQSLSKKEIKRLFVPYKIRKIHADYPIDKISDTICKTT